MAYSMVMGSNWRHRVGFGRRIDVGSPQDTTVEHRENILLTCSPLLVSRQRVGVPLIRTPMDFTFAGHRLPVVTK